MPLTALEETDLRSFEICVAGPAALLVAKAHKIHERQNSDRQVDKDALDVLRLLRGAETEDLATRYRKLLNHKQSQEAAGRAYEMLKAQFENRKGVGVQMAIRSAGPLADSDEIAAMCEALTGDLLSALS